MFISILVLIFKLIPIPTLLLILVVIVFWVMATHIGCLQETHTNGKYILGFRIKANINIDTNTKTHSVDINIGPNRMTKDGKQV